MSRHSKIVSLATVVALCALYPTVASAQCAVSTPFGNRTTTTFAICDDSGPVRGVAEAFDAIGTLIQTTDDRFICTDASQSAQGGPCSITAAGIAGDNQVTMNGNWGNFGVSGCPLQGLFRGRNFVNITDASGGQLLFSVGFDAAGGFFRYEDAWPADGSNLACSNPRTAVEVLNQTTVGNVADVQLRCLPPPIFSDCDATSRGGGVGSVTCPQEEADFLAAIQALNVYQLNAACAGRDVNYDVETGGWFPVASSRDGADPSIINTNITIPTDGSCAFLGCSFGVEGTTGFCELLFGGNPIACEAGDATGICTALALGPCIVSANEFTQVSAAAVFLPEAAPDPRAFEVAVAFKRGRAFVSWTTQSELGLAGFRVLRVGRDGSMTPIGGIISPRGVGGAGATYNEQFSPRDLRSHGGRGIVIKSLLTGGGEILSDPASL